MAHISNYLENAWANTLRGSAAAVSFTAPAAVYVKLHIGDPGEDGATNAAGNTVRQAITFGAAANGVITSDVLVRWTNVSTTETYSHISLWDAATLGNNLANGPLSASRAVTAGDTFDLPSGQVSLTVA